MATITESVPTVSTFTRRPAAIETNLTVDQSENRVIAAESDVFPGKKLRPALPDDDVAGDDRSRSQISLRPAVC